jgi:hypothetical protein
MDPDCLRRVRRERLRQGRSARLGADRHAIAPFDFTSD